MGIGSRRLRILPAPVPERNHGLAVANVVVQAAPERLPDLNFDRLSGVVLDGELESLPAIRSYRESSGVFDTALTGVDRSVEPQCRLELTFS
jgi:hypothetical protein